ncbi:MAG: hypothetical protein J4G15_00335 [Alphaproteobacteria bacterium]|nr:hypothetical protein [Alphaproteobacteria bacterium]
MHGERLDAELNLALGDKLTLVNRGFVQSLCLRFHAERLAAELAYADNLAETRRLMQLIREMQRQGVPLDPDGAATGPDRGEPDFQVKEKAVWQADLSLAARNLAALRRARSALETSPGLDRLIEEGAAFVSELHDRAEAAGNLVPASDAEGRSLEDFLEYLEDTDERFLAGEADTERPGDEALIAVLNTVLCNHFLAIEQFFLQGFLLEHCNEKALGEVRIGHSVDEMTCAFRVAQHIILLGAEPRPVFMPDIRLPHRVMVGSDPLAAIRHDLELTENLIATLEGAKTTAEPKTVDILSRSLETERKARTWLSGQLERLSKGEAPPEASGRFDMMLQRWAVA